MTKHIKLPLRTSGKWGTEIRDASGYQLASVTGIIRAKEVVTACNSHQVLLTALQAHQDVGDHVETCPRCGVGANCVEHNGLAKKADELTKSALAKVEEA